jgi:hypothetical protein
MRLISRSFRATIYCGHFGLVLNSPSPVASPQKRTPPTPRSTPASKHEVPCDFDDPIRALIHVLHCGLHHAPRLSPRRSHPRHPSSTNNPLNYSSTSRATVLCLLKKKLGSFNASSNETPVIYITLHRDSHVILQWRQHPYLSISSILIPFINTVLPPISHTPLQNNK